MLASSLVRRPLDQWRARADRQHGAKCTAEQQHFLHTHTQRNGAAHEVTKTRRDFGMGEMLFHFGSDFVRG